MILPKTLKKWQKKVLPSKRHKKKLKIFFLNIWQVSPKISNQYKKFSSHGAKLNQATMNNLYTSSDTTSSDMAINCDFFQSDCFSSDSRNNATKCHFYSCSKIFYVFFFPHVLENKNIINLNFRKIQIHSTWNRTNHDHFA